MTWALFGEEPGQSRIDTSQYEGFVYIITNKITGVAYVGKKFFHREWKIKGKRQRRESDWQNYWGSSTHLSADIAEYGRENFTREIIELCETRTYTDYREQYWLHALDVLMAKLPNGEYAYHNRCAGARKRRPDPPSREAFNALLEDVLSRPRL